jgi:hypothetical protein
VFDEALRAEARALVKDFDSELQGEGFYLAGGSGLALQLGHRVSEDLDFFTATEFQAESLSHALGTRPGYQTVMQSAGTLYCLVSGVKVSFIRQQAPLVFPTIPFSEIVLADWRDIVADKFETLAARGSRKDFYDLFAGLAPGRLSVGAAVDLLRRRFGPAQPNYYHILKSLTYFDDAEAEPESALLKPVAWADVKGFFVRNVREFERELLKESVG